MIFILTHTLNSALEQLVDEFLLELADCDMRLRCHQPPHKAFSKALETWWRGHRTDTEPGLTKPNHAEPSGCWYARGGGAASARDRRRW